MRTAEAWRFTLKCTACRARALHTVIFTDRAHTQAEAAALMRHLCSTRAGRRCPTCGKPAMTLTKAPPIPRHP